MPDFEMPPLNPVSILAFVLTCLGCLQTWVPIFLTSWWSVEYYDGSRTLHGVWTREDCSPGEGCSSQPDTRLFGGQESLFVSKIFATFTIILILVAVILHICYFFLRRRPVRTAAIFMAAGAGMFGLLSVLVFLGFYHSTNAGTTTSIGAAYYLFFVGTIFCIVAAAFTAWASVRKASAFELPEVDDDL